MAETGSVKVTIDDEKIKERMRDFLAQAWDEGQAAGFRFYRDHPSWKDRDRNPYRD